MTVHYKPYDDEPTACGLDETDDSITDVQDDVTCTDCKDEIR